MPGEELAPSQPAGLSPGLSKEQKIGFSLLLIFALLTVVLGFLQISNTLYAPFALNKMVPATIKDQIKDVQALRYRDTAGSGVSDFDKLYVYGMSPYLYDTFGYGMSDGEVIKRGLRLCPNAGKNCAPSESGSALPVATATSSPLVAAANPGTPPPDLRAILRDPTQIRQMLITAGVGKDIVAKVSDADLMKMAEQAFASSTAAGAVFGNMPSVSRTP